MNVADPVIVPLYPATYPAVIPAEKQEKAVNNVGFINNIHYPTLDVYLPAAGQATGCGVVICPGGGYTGLASDHEGKQIARWLNSFGVAGFVLKYRLPPDYRHPIPMQDAQRGLRVVRANAAKWNVNPQRIGVLGFSAGGHLASTVTTHFDGGNPQAADAVERQSCRPDFSVLCYAVICFAKEYCHSGSRINLLGDTLPADLVRNLSNELQVTADTPPTFLFHSLDDKSVDIRNSIDFFLACKQHGVTAEMHCFPKGGHGYGMGGKGTSESQWPALCQKWLAAIGMI